MTCPKISKWEADFASHHHPHYLILILVLIHSSSHSHHSTPHSFPSFYSSSTHNHWQCLLQWKWHRSVDPDTAITTGSRYRCVVNIAFRIRKSRFNGKPRWHRSVDPNRELRNKHAFSTGYRYRFTRFALPYRFAWPTVTWGNLR